MKAIKKNKKHNTTLIVALAVITALFTAYASARAVSKCSKPKVTFPKTCAGLNTSASVEGNPFVYTNPEASCDLGLELPGLPSLGFGLGDLNFCKIAKSLTGELVAGINKDMQDSVDGAMSKIGLEKDNDFALDLTDRAIEGLKRADEAERAALEGGSGGGGEETTTIGGVKKPKYNEYGQLNAMRGTKECPSNPFDRRECGFEEE